MLVKGYARPLVGILQKRRDREQCLVEDLAGVGPCVVDPTEDFRRKGEITVTQVHLLSP